MPSGVNSYRFCWVKFGQVFWVTTACSPSEMTFCLSKEIAKTFFSAKNVYRSSKVYGQSTCQWNLIHLRLLNIIKVEIFTKKELYLKRLSQSVHPSLSAWWRHFCVFAGTCQSCHDWKGILENLLFGDSISQSLWLLKMQFIFFFTLDGEQQFHAGYWVSIRERDRE